jgi:hypothetical protein
MDMNVEELMSHRKARRLIKNDLNFVIQNMTVVRTRITNRISMLYFKLVCTVILISICHILN